MAKAATANRLYETEERPMSETDRTMTGDELADVEQQLKAVEEEKKNVNTNYRVRIRKLKERADVLSRQWKDGVVEVSFDVVEEHDDATLMVNIVRKDTNKKISARPMTEPEKEAARRRRQKSIPGVVEDDYGGDAEPKAKRGKKGSKK